MMTILKKLINKTEEILNKTSWEINCENLTITHKSNFIIIVKSSTKAYRGKYFTMPCIVYKSPNLNRELSNKKDPRDIKEILNRALENSFRVQFDTIPAIYGVFKGKIIENTNENTFEVVSDKKGGDWYLVAQDHEGDVFLFEEGINFIRNEKPHLAKTLIYDYFSTVCYLLPKGFTISTDPLIYYNKKEEMNDIIDQTNKQNSILYNDNTEDIELFNPEHRSEVQLLFLPCDILKNICSCSDLFRAVSQNFSAGELSGCGIFSAIEIFRKYLYQACKEDQELKNSKFDLEKSNIFLNFGLFIDFVFRIYFGVSFQYIVNQSKFANLIDLKKFCGLEYVGQICKRLCKFILLGAMIIEFEINKNNQKLKREDIKIILNDINKKCIEVWTELNDSFENLIGMDILLEDIPKKMIYSPCKSEDLF